MSSGYGVLQPVNGGVDKNDQLRKYYHVRLKSRKFYRYIFWFLFEVSLVNAYILHAHYSGATKRPLKEFRFQVARGLIGDYNSRKRAGHASLTPTVFPLHHYPVKFAENADKKIVLTSLLVLSHQTQPTT